MNDESIGDSAVVTGRDIPGKTRTQVSSIRERDIVAGS
jgi:hypothetical protein